MIMPHPGTKEADDFMKRATQNPSSMEAQIVRQAHEQAANQMQSNLRKMLNQMIYLAPGRLFRDIGAFHEKFGLSPVEEGHKLPEDLLAFRLKFLMEELTEYANSCGYSIRSEMYPSSQPRFDAENAFDGLIDLVYVALGTAFLHGFPFDEGWARVHDANMAKVRASGPDDERSTRKHSADIVKPEGWTKPVLDDLLRQEAK